MRSTHEVTWSPLRAPREVCFVDGVRMERFGLDRSNIGEPLRWREPRTVAVAGDPWGRLVDPRDAAAIFAVMASANGHNFHLSVEDTEVMRRWFAWVALGGRSAVALYNTEHEIRHPTLVGRVDPPTPELRFIYDMGADRVTPHLRGRAARRGRLGEFHWQKWPLGNVSIEEAPRG